MAETALTGVVRDEKYGIKSYLASWASIPNGNTGAVLDMAPYADRSVQVSGTFGAGGSLTMQGSNDGTNFYTLLDPAGAAITFTAAGLKQILQVAKFMRPIVTAGDGTTSLNVNLVTVGK